MFWFFLFKQYRFLSASWRIIVYWISFWSSHRSSEKNVLPLWTADTRRWKSLITSECSNIRSWCACCRGRSGYWIYWIRHQNQNRKQVRKHSKPWRSLQWGWQRGLPLESNFARCWCGGYGTSKNTEIQTVKCKYQTNTVKNWSRQWAAPWESISLYSIKKW